MLFENLTPTRSSLPKTGNLVEINGFGRRSFVGHCISISGHEVKMLKLHSLKLGVTRTFPIVNSTEFNVLNGRRIRQARGYYMRDLSSAKIKRKLRVF